MFLIISADGNSTGIYYTNEREARRNMVPGETLKEVPRKSRGYLHNDID